MSAQVQVVSIDSSGLVVAANSSEEVAVPISNNINIKQPSPLPPAASSVSRVITKESLHHQDDVEPPAGSSPIEADIVQDIHETLYEFSSLLDDDDRVESELLSLPLTNIELPVTTPTTTAVSAASSSSSSSSSSDGSSSFETCAATLLTPAGGTTTVSESSDCSSSLLSTAAAIAAVEQSVATPSSLSIQAPTLVAVPSASTGTATATAPLLLPVVSPKPKAKRRPRANNSKSNNNSSKNKKAASSSASSATKKRTQTKRVSPILPTIASTTGITTRLVPKRTGIMDQEQSQQPPTVAPEVVAVPTATATTTTTSVPTPSTIANPAVAIAAAAAPVETRPPTTTGQPLPPKQFVPSTQAAVRAQVVAPAPPPAAAAYHVHHHAVVAPPPPPPPPPQPSRARATSNKDSQTSNTVSTLHPTTGQVENTGRWTAEEHRLFLQGLEQHGKGWKKIATLIKSRTVVQIRTHAQKYFQKLAKARQNGESVGGAIVGGVVTSVPSGIVGGVPIGTGTGENGESLGITIPVGPDGQPVVTMRTTTNSHSTVVHHTAGNMAIGSDPTSLAAAAGNVGIATAGGGGVSSASSSGRGGGRKRSNSRGGTKRRAIGNVVRSSVREGRNIKRQKVAETKRNKKAAAAAAAAGPPSAPQVAGAAPAVQPTVADTANKDEYQVPNPLPAISNVLDPYVTTTMGMPPPTVTHAAAAAAQKKKGQQRGRQQLVHTATHGTLPMAALEDAVFRLLTPATGAPAPTTTQQQQPPQQQPGAIVDPLAPAPVPQGNKIAVAHTQYPSPPVTSSAYPQAHVPNSSPTGVADMALMPSWVDAKNPPTWYNAGDDIDTLLEDADCLNWLSDTGDLDETYPPAMAEPAAVVSSASTTVPVSAVPEPASVVGVMPDPTGGVVHPSTESLSFLVDPPEQPLHAVDAAATAPEVVDTAPHHVAVSHVEDVNQLPTFLEDSEAPVPETPATAAFSSATEAVEAAEVPEHKLAGVGESDTNLMGFPDLDMGDEQAFVSALLENSGQSTMSFPKLGSDMHLSGNQSGVALSGVDTTSALLKEDNPVDETA